MLLYLKQLCFNYMDVLDNADCAEQAPHPEH